MKNHLSRLFGSFFCLALFTSCGEFNEDPGVPTEKTTRGWIIAGETGSRVISSDIPITYCVGCPEINPFQYLNYENVGSIGTIYIHCGYESNEFTEFYQCSTYPIEYQVEYAKLSIVDSVMICYDIDPDTTIGTITHSNVITQAECSHPLVFERSYILTTPQPFPAGARIDATLSWTTELGMFNRWSHTTNVHANLVTRQVLNNPLWEEYGRQYVGIRTKRGDDYRYGYMDVVVFRDHVVVNRVALER